MKNREGKEHLKGKKRRKKGKSKFRPNFMTFFPPKGFICIVG
jgi:hypothetical protein